MPNHQQVLSLLIVCGTFRHDNLVIKQGNDSGYRRKVKRMKELFITMTVTAMLFLMTFIVASFTHLVPEKQTIIEARNAAVTLHPGSEISIIVEDGNPINP